MLQIQGTENSKPASLNVILLSRRRRANYTSGVKFLLKFCNLRIRIYTVFYFILTFVIIHALFRFFKPLSRIQTLESKFFLVLDVDVINTFITN